MGDDEAELLQKQGYRLAPQRMQVLQVMTALARMLLICTDDPPLVAHDHAPPVASREHYCRARAQLPQHRWLICS